MEKFRTNRVTEVGFALSIEQVGRNRGRCPRCASPRIGHVYAGISSSSSDRRTSSQALMLGDSSGWPADCAGSLVAGDSCWTGDRCRMGRLPLAWTPDKNGHQAGGRHATPTARRALTAQRRGEIGFAAGMVASSRASR